MTRIDSSEARSRSFVCSAFAQLPPQFRETVSFGGYLQSAADLSAIASEFAEETLAVRLTSI